MDPESQSTYEIRKSVSIAKDLSNCCVIVSITPFLSNFASLDLVVVCFSYNQKVSFQIIADKKIQMNPDDLKEFIETNFDGRVLKLKNENI